MIKRIIEGKFINVNNDNKEKCERFIYKKDNKEIILYLYDTDGDKEKRDLSKNYYKNSDYIIMGYDCIIKKVFKKLQIIGIMILKIFVKLIIFIY